MDIHVYIYRLMRISAHERYCYRAYGFVVSGGWALCTELFFSHPI